MAANNAPAWYNQNEKAAYQWRKHQRNGMLCMAEHK